PSGTWPLVDKDDYPVANVDYCDAVAYCAWAGRRLCGKIGGGHVAQGDLSDPTQDEWYNACSAGGVKGFPYGIVTEPTACNTIEYGAGDALPVASLSTCEGGWPGIYDMVGNVAEWEDCDGGGTGWCRLRGGGFIDTTVAAIASCQAIVPEAIAMPDCAAHARRTWWRYLIRQVHSASTRPR